MATCSNLLFVLGPPKNPLCPNTMTTPMAMDGLELDELYQRAREELETKLSRARSSDDPKRALSEIIDPLGEQCDVSPLVLYKLVTRSRVQNCIDGNLLPKEDCAGWHIALREQLNEAVQREIKYAGHVGKDSHVVLRVTFHPLGIAFFTTSYGDDSYQFKPVLHKVSYGGSTDWGAWRFIRDLPLSMKSSLGEPMVSSEWLEIW